RTRTLSPSSIRMRPCPKRECCTTESFSNLAIVTPPSQALVVSLRSHRYGEAGCRTPDEDAGLASPALRRGTRTRSWPSQDSKRCHSEDAVRGDGESPGPAPRGPSNQERGAGHR